MTSVVRSTGYMLGNFFGWAEYIGCPPNVIVGGQLSTLPPRFHCLYVSRDFASIGHSLKHRFGVRLSVRLFKLHAVERRHLRPAYISALLSDGKYTCNARYCAAALSTRVGITGGVGEGVDPTVHCANPTLIFFQFCWGSTVTPSFSPYEIGFPQQLKKLTVAL